MTDPVDVTSPLERFRLKLKRIDCKVRTPMSSKSAMIMFSTYVFAIVAILLAVLVIDPIVGIVLIGLVVGILLCNYLSEKLVKWIRK